MCLSVSLSVCPSVVCQCVCLSVCLSVVRLYFCLSVCSSLRPSICPCASCSVSVCLSLPLSFPPLSRVTIHEVQESFLSRKFLVIGVCLSFSDELGRVRLRHGSKPGSDYINASFIDVCNTTAYLHT